MLFSLFKFETEISSFSLLSAAVCFTFFSKLLPNSYYDIQYSGYELLLILFQVNALDPSYHCLHTPGGPLQYSLEGHPFAPFGLGITSDARYLVSVSNMIIIWDLRWVIMPTFITTFTQAFSLVMKRLKWSP